MGDVVSATVQGTKRDKKSSYGVAEFVYDEAGNKINELEYVLPSVLTDTAGDVAMQIDLMSSAGERVKSFSFYIKVQNALFNEDDMISDSDFSGFRDLLNRCTATLEKMEAMTEADALPNPFALDIEIEGEHTVYTGGEAKEVSLNNMAYIDESEDVIIEDALDESAASRAAASAQAASNSKDAVELLVDQASDLADTMGGYRNETLGYKNDAENSRFQSIQASLLAEGYKNDADLSRSQSVQASLLAEGYSVGTQNGEEVAEGSPYYHNNAKWFKENSVDVKVSGLSNKGRSLAKVTIDGKDNYIRLGEVDASEIAFGDGTVSSELTEINNYDQILAGQISSVEGRVEALEEGGTGGGSASGVTYDNSTTQISANNVQDAIDSVFTSVSNGKDLIASAITDKGIETLATDTFAVMAQHIAEIEGGGGTVQHEEYYGNAVALYNKTITSKLTGTFRGIFYSYTDRSIVIKNNNNVVDAIFDDSRASVHHYSYYEFEVNKDDSINFSISNTGDNSFCLGWYITDGTSGGGVDVSDTTATASDVLRGKNFYDSNGNLTSGNIAEYDSGLTPYDIIWCNNTKPRVLIPHGYQKKPFYVGIDTTRFRSDKIKKGEEILGFVGTYEPLGANFKSGNIKLTTSEGATVDLGFRPRFIILIQAGGTTSSPTNYIIYDEDVGYKQTMNGSTVIDLPSTAINRMADVTDTGFVMNKVSNISTVGTVIYWAFG